MQIATLFRCTARPALRWQTCTEFCQDYLNYLMEYSLCDHDWLPDLSRSFDLLVELSISPVWDQAHGTAHVLCPRVRIGIYGQRFRGRDCFVGSILLPRLGELGWG